MHTTNRDGMSLKSGEINRIPKFNGNNFNSFRRQFKAYSMVVKPGLMKCFEVDEEDYNRTKTKRDRLRNMINNLDDHLQDENKSLEESKDQVKTLEKKLEIYSLFFNMLILCMSESTYMELDNMYSIEEDNGPLLWKLLEQKYIGNKNLVMYTMQKWLSIKEAESGDNTLQKYINEYRNLLEKLEASGEVPSELIKFSVLLNGLAKKRARTKNYLRRDMKDEINIREIIKMLLLEEEEFEVKKNVKVMKKNVCNNFKRYGNCKFGKKCKYKHVNNKEKRNFSIKKEDEIEVKHNQNKVKLECFQYKEKGSCKYGDRCRYVHQISDKDDENSLKKRIAELETEIKILRKSDEVRKEFVNILSKNEMIIDSGAGVTCVKEIDLLKDKNKVEEGSVYTANNKEIKVNIKGKISTKIEDAMYVPNFKHNILSVSQYCKDNDTSVLFTKHKVHIIDKKETIPKRLLNGISGREKNGLYYVDADVLVNEYREIDKIKMMEQFHLNIGHQSIKKFIKAAAKGYIKDMNRVVLNGKNNVYCNDCVIAKHKNKIPGSSNSTVNIPLRTMAYDTVGKLIPEAYNKSVYSNTLIDYASNYIWVTCSSSKSQGSMKLIDLMKEIQNTHDKKIKILRSDRAKELIQGRLKNFCKENGIRTEQTVAHQHYQNGKVERAHRTIFEIARAMQYSSDIPGKYWPFCIQYATYIYNRSPCSANEDNRPPILVLKQVIPSMDEFKQYGRYVSVKNDRLSRGKKLDPKAYLGRFLGYDSTSKGMNILVKTKVEIRSQVVFLDKTNINKLKEKHQKEIEIDEEESDSEEDDVTKIRKSTRNRIPTSTLDFRNQQLKLLKEYKKEVTIGNISYAKAKDSAYYRKAIMKEVNSHKKMQTVTEISQKDMPKDAKVIRGMWIINEKKDDKGHPIKAKARYVLCGNHQTWLDGVYAPVVDRVIINLLIYLKAKQRRNELIHADVSCAFLYSVRDKQKHGRLFTYPIPGYGVERGKMLEIEKDIYGLKEANNSFYKNVNRNAEKLGWIKMEEEPCLMKRGNEIMAIHVDDFLILTTGKNSEKTKRELSEIYDMKYEMANFYLGTTIMDNDRWIQLHQIAKIEDTFNTSEKIVLKWEKYMKRKPRTKYNTPLPTDFEKQLGTSTIIMTAQKDCQILTGKLLYICTHTRPDISYAVSALSRWLHKPSISLIFYLHRISIYLYHSKNLGIRYNKEDDYGNNYELDIYSDASYADYGGKSTTGYIILINNRIIEWKSKKQSTVALSSTEAELVAAIGAMKRMLFIIKILTFLNLKVSRITLHIDNMSTISILQEEVYQGRVRHLQVKYHKLKELQQAIFIQDKKIGKLEIKHVRTEENIADICTKSLGVKQHLYLCNKILSLK